MNGFCRAVRDVLVAAGCFFVRHGEGDHDISLGPISGRTFNVPVTVQLRHTANKILKDAGLAKTF